jgi:hypothetical protein
LYFALASFLRAGPDPFAFFEPSLTITDSERARLEDGYPIARVLQSRGLEVGVVAAIPVSIDGDRLVACERRIEEKNDWTNRLKRYTFPQQSSSGQWFEDTAMKGSARLFP